MHNDNLGDICNLNNFINFEKKCRGECFVKLPGGNKSKVIFV